MFFNSELYVVEWGEWLDEMFGWGRWGDTNFWEDLDGHWKRVLVLV